jgi:hypothetical protein
VSLPPMVCSALVAGCRGSGAEQQAVHPGRGMLHDEVVPVGAKLYSADR